MFTYLKAMILSARKTMAMNKVANLMLHPDISSFQNMIRYSEEKTKAFKALYKELIKFPGYSDVLELHKATSEDLEKIAERILLAGYHFAYNGDFIPVALISLSPIALDQLLTQEEKLLYHTDYEGVQKIVEPLIPLLFTV